MITEMRCFHFKICRTPCFPVAEYLRRDNLTVFEKSHTDENGQTVTMLFSKSRELLDRILFTRSRISHL